VRALREASLAQSLYLLNSAEIQGKLSSGGGKAASSRRIPRGRMKKRFESSTCSPTRVSHPPRTSSSRWPLEEADGKTKAYEDVTWALLNTKEFLFNH
jgi:hypothetical protein